MALEKAEGMGGLKLYVDSMPGMQTAEIGVFVGAGSVHEPDQLAGISHALEHCVHLSTDAFPDRQSLRDYEGENSFDANANTFYNRTYYHGSGPETEPIFFYMGQTLFRTKFEPELVANEMKVITREAKTGLDKDDQLHAAAVDFTCFGTPYGRMVLGYHDRLNFDPQQLREYYEKHYSLGNMAVIAVGNVTVEQVSEMTSKYFGQTEQEGGTAAEPIPMTVELEQDVRSALVRDASENVRYIYRYPLRGEFLDVVRYERPVYEVAMGAIASRCYELLRNERGISYNGGVYFSTYNNPNAWSIGAFVTTDAENTHIADEVFAEVAAAGGADYDDKKLRAAYGEYKGDVLRTLDSIDGRANFHLNRLMALREPRDLSGVIDEIRDMDAVAIRGAIDSISSYMLTAPKVMHKTGRFEDVKEADVFVDLRSIA